MFIQSRYKDVIPKHEPQTSIDVCFVYLDYLYYRSILIIIGTIGHASHRVMAICKKLNLLDEFAIQNGEPPCNYSCIGNTCFHFESLLWFRIYCWYFKPKVLQSFGTA